MGINKETLRNGAMNSGRNCDTAKYIGISRRSFRCGSYRQVAKRCNSDNSGYLIINREKFDNGQVTKLTNQKQVLMRHDDVNHTK